jgi:hypothetical protein
MKSNKPFGWLVPKRITENRFKINPMAIGLTNLHVPWATGVLVPSRHYHLSPAIVIQPSLGKSNYEHFFNASKIAGNASNVKSSRLSFQKIVTGILPIAM